MNREVASVTVHAAGNGNARKTKQTFSTSENPSDDQQPPKRNGRPSRHWLVSELERIKEKYSELNKQCEFQKDLVSSLSDKKSHLEREIASLRSRRIVGTHENEAIRERNKQLSQDVFIMKNILVKLNLELERYQDKLRSYENTELKIVLNTEYKHDCNHKIQRKTDWISGEITIIAPLLLAYEESLREKEDLIGDFKITLEKLSGKMKEVVRENSELRMKIAESEMQGEVNYSDWMTLQRELDMSIEQNQLLSRQAKLTKKKITDLKTAFQSKLNEVCSERDEAISKLSSIRTEYFVLKGRNSALEEEFERLKEDSGDRIPKSIHSAYISECKRLLDELKSRHAEERTSLLRRIADLEEGEQSQMENSPPVMAKKLRETEAKLLQLEEKRLRCERKREAMKERIDGLVQFSKELISEHESLLTGVNGELCHNLNLSSRIESIKQQLKGVELETLEQIKMLDQNITSQVEKVNRVRIEKNREVLKLKEELKSKDIEIHELKNGVK